MENQSIEDQLINFIVKSKNNEHFLTRAAILLSKLVDGYDIKDEAQVFVSDYTEYLKGLV